MSRTFVIRSTSQAPHPWSILRNEMIRNEYTTYPIGQSRMPRVGVVLAMVPSKD